MALQFPRGGIGESALDVRNRNVNALQTERNNTLINKGMQQSQEVQQRALDRDAQAEIARVLTGIGTQGAELIAANPAAWPTLRKDIVGHFERLGFPQEAIAAIPPANASMNAMGPTQEAAGQHTQAVLEGLQGLQQQGQMIQATLGQTGEDPKLVKDAAGYQRHAGGPNFGERAFPDVVAEPGADAATPAKIQQAEWWLQANPEQRAGYMSANYAGKVQEIAGVPHWVMPGGEAVPLSSLEQEKSSAAEISLAEGEGARGRLEGEGGEFVNVPGSEADVKQQEADRKRGGGAFMKSIQAQTVVDDVARLNKQIEAGDVPFGRTAAIQKNLHPAAQTDGYRNANSLIESVKGNVGIDSLLRIKATGAGLGQVPQSQLDLLSRLLGELDMNQSEAQFIYTWNRMGAVYETIMMQADEGLYELDMERPNVTGDNESAPSKAVQYDAQGNRL